MYGNLLLEFRGHHTFVRCPGNGLAKHTLNIQGKNKPLSGPAKRSSRKVKVNCRFYNYVQLCLQPKGQKQSILVNLGLRFSTEVCDRFGYLSNLQTAPLGHLGTAPRSPF